MDYDKKEQAIPNRNLFSDEDVIIPDSEEQEFDEDGIPYL